LSPKLSLKGYTNIITLLNYVSQPHET